MVLASISRYPEQGRAGVLIGTASHEAETYINARDNVAQVVDVAITAQNSTAYTLLIGGITITVTSDASGTAAEVRDLFLAAIAANSYTNALVSAAASGADVRITERTPGNGNVVIAESDANLALTVVTAHQQVEPMRAGIMLSKMTAAATGLSRDRLCRLPTTGDALANFAGVSIHQINRAFDERYAAADEIVYAPGDLVACLREGRLWVRTEQDVTIASAVFVRIIASGANTILGNFRVDADSGNAVAVPNCQFKGVATAGGLVELVVNMP